MSPLLIALIGAVVGGALTIAGDVCLRVTVEARRFKALRATLIIEVSEILRRSVELGLVDAAGIRVTAPLPDSAWRATLSAGGVERFDERELQALLALYERVREANHLASQGHVLFALAQLASDDASGGLEAEASRLTTEPFRAVERAATDATRILTKAGD